MATREILSLDESTPQILAPQTGDTYLAPRTVTIQPEANTSGLVVSSGTLTADAPALDLTQTWNNSGVTFTGIKFNVPTDSSASGSLLMDLQVGGASKFKVGKDGTAYFVEDDVAISRPTSNTLGITAGSGMSAQFKTNSIATASTGAFAWLASTSLAGTPDTFLWRDDVGIIAQRRTSAGGTDYPQTFRIYNKYTDASNYERGFLDWNAATNVFRIGTEKDGTGSARALELQTDGTTRLTISSTGVITSNSGILYVNTGVGIASGSGATLSLRYAGVEYINVGSNLIKYRDAANFEFGTTTGTKIGTATSEKLAFWNATPIVQPTTAIAEAAFVENSGGTAVNVDSTFDGYTLQQIAKALRDAGLLA